MPAKPQPPASPDPGPEVTGSSATRSRASSARRAEHAADTREALIGAARRLFAADGFDDTGTEQIVAEARVTRGALYHHFRDKADLFAAVAEEVFFRRLVYGWLASSRGAAVAIWGSAVAFAAIHVPVYGFAVLPIDTAAGLLLGWQRWMTGGWSASGLTHVAANLIAEGVIP